MLPASAHPPESTSWDCPIDELLNWLHHFKNEHYWFSVTTSGTSDRVLGTYPDAITVETSATAKNLHGLPG